MRASLRLYSSHGRLDSTTDGDRASEFIFDWNEVTQRAAHPEERHVLRRDAARRAAEPVASSTRTSSDKLKHPPPDGGPRHPRGRHRPARQLEQARLRRRAPHVQGGRRLQDEDPDRLRGAHGGRRHHADDRDLAARGHARSRSTPSSARARSASTPRQWDVELIAKRSAEAIDVAVKAGLAGRYVTEDTTRSRPEVLTTLFRAAIDHGASRLCLSRHRRPRHARRRAQPDPVHASSVIAGTGAKDSGIDWHGHNDRGLALENALWALEFGADRVHAHGARHRRARRQRADGALLLNLKLLGQLDEQDLTKLLEYCETVARGGGLAGPDQLPARRPRRLPHRHGRARRRDHQGDGRRATRGSPTASTAASPPACSAASRRSASAS